MILIKEFCQSASHTRQDFMQTWGALVDYINGGADGAVTAPYQLKADLDVTDMLDVYLDVRLERAHAIAGQQEPHWSVVARQFYSNTNLAGFLPFGDAYRFFIGRDKAMTASPAGPMPLYPQIRKDDDDTRQGFRDWVRTAITDDQKRQGRPVFRLIPGGKHGPDA